MFEQKEKQTETAEDYKIVRPENRELLDKLERKLAEYEERKNRYQKELDNTPSDMDIVYKYNDAFYKAAVLGFLLVHGTVDEHDIIFGLQDMKKDVDFDILSSAFKIIKAYVEGGNVSGGSGLK
jgi:hypothetical protein